MLHCLPSHMGSRGPALDNLAKVLRPAVFCSGATLLGTRDAHNWLSYQALRSNNRKGFFDNVGDSELELGELLSGRFSEVEMDRVGAVVLFAARRPSVSSG